MNVYRTMSFPNSLSIFQVLQNDYIRIITMLAQQILWNCVKYPVHKIRPTKCLNFFIFTNVLDFLRRSGNFYFLQYSTFRKRGIIFFIVYFCYDTKSSNQSTIKPCCQTTLILFKYRPYKTSFVFVFLSYHRLKMIYFHQFRRPFFVF